MWWLDTKVVAVRVVLISFEHNSCNLLYFNARFDNSMQHIRVTSYHISAWIRCQKCSENNMFCILCTELYHGALYNRNEIFFLLILIYIQHSWGISWGFFVEVSFLSTSSEDSIKLKDMKDHVDNLHWTLHPN